MDTATDSEAKMAVGEVVAAVPLILEREGGLEKDEPELGDPIPDKF